jgi:Xaa-Pro aminopeptidase
MNSLIAEKLAQAEAIVAQSGADVWLTFVRETDEGGDPVLPFLIDGGLTWQSALIVTADGRRIAVVGNYDADALRSTGNWTEVIGYVQSIRQPLLEVLESACAMGRKPRIALNFSTNDAKADGLSLGLLLLLQQYFAGTRFEDTFESAESIVMALRGRKTGSELVSICKAIRETETLFKLIGREARIGMTEHELYLLIQKEIDSRGLGYAWEREGDPIVNSGPDSMVGHGAPSDKIRIEPGHILHVDLGVIQDGYASDIQRCWYVPKEGETKPPAEVTRAFESVNAAITAASRALKPGVEGHVVDQAARESIVKSGYPEYLHAVGHQVGRVAHDGGGILGPKWERYGRTPELPVEENQIYTLELGVEVEGHGYLGIEEMARVTDIALDWLTERQWKLPLLGAR